MQHVRIALSCRWRACALSRSRIFIAGKVSAGKWSEVRVNGRLSVHRGRIRSKHFLSSVSVREKHFVLRHGARQRADSVRLQSAVDTSSEVDLKISAALLNAVTTAALDAALLGKADAAEVDTKMAYVLLGLATEAFVAAQLASRDASVREQTDATLLALYATSPRRNPRGAAALAQKTLVASPRCPAR